MPPFGRMIENIERQRNATSTTGRGSTAQNVNVTDVICEGPIRGLVDGTRSVYLDDVPVEDARFSDFAPDSFLNGRITFSSGSAVGTVDSNTDLSELEFDEGSSRSLKLLYKQTTATATSVSKVRAKRKITLQASSGSPFTSAWENGAQLSNAVEARVLLTHSDAGVPPVAGIFKVTNGTTAEFTSPMENTLPREPTLYPYITFFLFPE